MSTLDPARDALVVAKRNLIKIKRVPDLLVFTTLSPIMFVLLFAYVFGGAIDKSGGGSAYREFLIAGIFAQTVVFGATITGAGIAEDVQKGIIDRFRTLPMSPSAVLAGRTLSDVVNNVLVLIVMSLTGLLVGWRITTSVLDALAAYLLLLAFAYAISWIMAWIGLIVPQLTGIRPLLTPVAALGLIVVMIGAVTVTLMTQPVSLAILPFVTGVLLCVVAYGRLQTRTLVRQV